MTLYLSHFFYTVNGGFMTVYIDGVLFLNFYLDFLLLLTVVVILKRNVRIFRVILGAFVGSLTILVLFFEISSLELFFIKIYLSFLMCILCFGYHNLKMFLTNIFTFYIVSILLGGFLYFLNITFSYKSVGLVFINEGLSVNAIFLILVSPIILYLYVKQVRMFKRRLSCFFKTNIYIGRKVLKLNGYLDTGNTLSYKKRPVILTNIDNSFRNKKVYIPYIVIGGTGILECIKVRKVEVIGIGVFENVYLGFSKDFKAFGCDVLLNGLMKGDIYD